jgi:hypothetical protein
MEHCSPGTHGAMEKTSSKTAQSDIHMQATRGRIFIPADRPGFYDIRKPATSFFLHRDVRVDRGCLFD